MTMLAIIFWLGGMSAAYRLNRQKGLTRLASGREAFIWIFGLGYGICMRFYINDDWGKE